MQITDWYQKWVERDKKPTYLFFFFFIFFFFFGGGGCLSKFLRKESTKAQGQTPELYKNNLPHLSSKQQKLWKLMATLGPTKRTNELWSVWASQK